MTATRATTVKAFRRAYTITELRKLQQQNLRRDRSTQPAINWTKEEP